MTCCLLASKRYGCCPFPNAVCCQDHVHCCPASRSNLWCFIVITLEQWGVVSLMLIQACYWKTEPLCILYPKVVVKLHCCFKVASLNRHGVWYCAPSVSQERLPRHLLLASASPSRAGGGGRGAYCPRPINKPCHQPHWWPGDWWVSWLIVSYLCQ